MARSLPPIPHIRTLFNRLCPEQTLRLAAVEMAKAPEQATSQLRGLLMEMKNGHPHGVGYGSGTALIAVTRLQEFVDGDMKALTFERFAEQLMYVQQLDRDLRQQLGAAGPQEPSKVEALQKALDKTARTLRFLGKGPA